MIESTTTTPSDFYGGSRILLEGIIDEFLSCIGMIRRYQKSQTGWDPISSSTSRVKSPESMREKLIRDGLEPTLQNALAHEHDAAGVRLICPMVDDVYRTAELIRAIPDVTILREKDFIAHPKPNGYRSYHMILKMPVRFLGNTSETAALPCLEVQIRTIAMDCWASIEHELKYKHDIANPELMQQELKHCSDQIASTDLSLSTLKELILTPNADPDANFNTSAVAEKPVASDCRGIPLG
ncbi:MULTISPECIES: GTP pyrophosphokinase family protein [unclassified Clostridium]|uniref:GTP pyrophosphokinase n=1 Tax=unclassified Clostridium TaxID=2614128 RepID=UPI0023537808|nr:MULTISPECIES: GTP pyrophosphokinase family protein [unclassified Clostridium]